MSILGTDAYRFALSSQLSGARENVSLVSAFITVPGIEWVLKYLSTTTVSLRVLSRWSCWDLVVGASDLDVYGILNARGARFYILPDLHAKIALIDDSVLFLGSANVTNSGLQLVPGGNREIGISIFPTLEDIQVIDSLFAESTEVSPELFEEIREEVNKLRRNFTPPERPVWSAELMVKLMRESGRLWVAELPWRESSKKLVRPVQSAEQEIAQRHDLALLGVDLTSSEAQITKAFLSSRACRWIVTKLEMRDTRELYFGEVTAMLHDALLDDPKPYRQDVKTLTLNLINWTEEMVSTVSVDRPKHSQRLRLNQS